MINDSVIGDLWFVVDNFLSLNMLEILNVSHQNWDVE